MVKLLQFYLQKGGAKKTAALKKLCEENGISFVKLGKFHNIRWSAWRHETLLKISRLLPAIKMQLATSDNSDLQHICTERSQCFLSNMLDIGNILKTASIRFQKEKLTIGECKDELMVAIGQFTLLLDGDLHSFGNTTVCSILKKYEATLQLDKDTNVTEWMRLKQAGKTPGGLFCL